MDIHFYEMTLNDFDEVIALWSTTPGVGLNESDTRPAVADYLVRNPGLSQVARLADGRLIAAVLCGHDGRRGYLHHLAVVQELQRRGIGRSMVQRCLEMLANQGITRCNIFLYADNGAGRVFWDRLGYRHRAELCVLQAPTRPEPGGEVKSC